MAKEKLELVEVSPRDGLQNEPDIVSTENKLALIDHILAAGFRRLEAGSFVNPKKVPQMADGDAVFAGVRKRGDATFIALALNLRGVFERAQAPDVAATVAVRFEFEMALEVVTKKQQAHERLALEIAERHARGPDVP